MNTNNNDKLKSLFQQVELNSPSSSFESRLMEKIHLKATKKIRKRNLSAYLALLGGIIAIIGIPMLIFKLMEWPILIDLKKTSLTMPNISFNPFIIIIACVALLLLISDTMIRHNIWNKKHKG